MDSATPIFFPNLIFIIDMVLIQEISIYLLIVKQVPSGILLFRVHLTLKSISVFKSKSLFFQGLESDHS